MSAMGVLFIVVAGIIAIRNLALYYVDYSAGLIENSWQEYLNKITNSQITNEKFVFVMLGIGGFLLYWGYFIKKEDYGPPDEHERRRFR
ncbi:MAG: hypothetical protein ABI361_07935 [Nitrososphaera sp.]|jgi:hypothetical protein